MKMKFKKETKHTVVYEAADSTAVVPVESVYVSKIWLALLVRVRPSGREGDDKNIAQGWPQEIELEVDCVSFT